MYLETRKVSRKTPGDGKLEISGTTFRALEGAGSKLAAILDQRESACALITFECTCNKMGGAHQHYFAQCSLFHELPADISVRLDLQVPQLRLIVTPL